MSVNSQIDFDAAKSELAATAAKSGVLVSGVADANAFDAAPDGRRPVDLLPKAKSVFVIGGAQPRAGDWQSPNYQHMEVTTTSDRIQTGLSSGEGLIWAIRDPIYKKDQIKKDGLVTGDYQDLLVDEGVEDKRLLVIESEYALTLRVLGRDGNTLYVVDLGFRYFEIIPVNNNKVGPLSWLQAAESVFLMRGVGSGKRE